MPKTSFYGRIIDIDDNTFSVDRGVHAGEAFLLRNNLAHAIDSATQLRVNWSSQVGVTYGVHYLTSGGPVLYLEEFPLTWLAPDKPANLYVLVAFNGNDASAATDYSYRVRIVPANTAPGQGGSLAVFDVSGTETDGTITTVTGNVTGTDFIQQLRTAWTPVGLTNDGDAFRNVSLCMLRLEVEISFAVRDSEDDFNIFSAYVMEYA